MKYKCINCGNEGHINGTRRYTYEGNESVMLYASCERCRKDDDDFEDTD